MLFRSYKIEVGETEAGLLEVGTEEMSPGTVRVLNLRVPGENWFRITLTTASFTGTNKALVGW